MAHGMREQPRSDTEIAWDVVSALSMDERVDPKSIVVEVAEGVVRLSGAVSSESQRVAAEEIARQTPGVVQVADDVTVAEDSRRPDRDIEADVRESLDTDAALSDPTLIRVSCVAGTVRLEGAVTSNEERTTAEKDAWYTAGVVYVENRLRTTGRRERRAVA